MVLTHLRLIRPVPGLFNCLPSAINRSSILRRHLREFSSLCRNTVVTTCTQTIRGTHPMGSQTSSRCTISVSEQPIGCLSVMFLLQWTDMSSRRQRWPATSPILASYDAEMSTQRYIIFRTRTYTDCFSSTTLFTRIRLVSRPWPAEEKMSSRQSNAVSLFAANMIAGCLSFIALLRSKVFFLFSCDTDPLHG